MADSPAAPAAPADDGSGTLRRAIAIGAGIAAPFVAAWLAKLGVDVPTEQVVAIEVAIVGYLGQSVLNAIHARAVNAAKPAASTPASAVADLSLGPKP